jgi:hypothetical protein
MSADILIGIDNPNIEAPTFETIKATVSFYFGMESKITPLINFFHGNSRHIIRILLNRSVVVN